MIRTLKPTQRLVQVGVTALRAPDGSFLPSVPMYIIVPEETINARTLLTADEEAACDALADSLVATFATQMKEIEAAKRRGGGDEWGTQTHAKNTPQSQTS